MPLFPYIPWLPVPIAPYCSSHNRNLIEHLMKIIAGMQKIVLSDVIKADCGKPLTR
jgi:hypothetical protein